MTERNAELQEFYECLVFQCLCKNSNTTSKSILHKLKSAVQDTTCTEDTLLAVSIIRFSGELLKASHHCEKVFEFMRCIASTFLGDLILCFQRNNHFINFITRKSLCLMIEHFPNVAESCLLLLCNSVKDSPHVNFNTVSEILKNKNRTRSGSLKLAEQELTYPCASVRKIKTSDQIIGKDYQEKWLVLIMDQIQVWICKYSLSFPPLLNLFTQLVLTFLESQDEKNIRLLFCHEKYKHLKDIGSCPNSFKTLLGIYRKVLSSDCGLSSELKDLISRQYISSINDGLIYNFPSKRISHWFSGFCSKNCPPKSHELGDLVITRELVLCTMQAALDTTDMTWVCAYKNICIWLNKSPGSWSHKQHEKCMINLFIEQDDQLVEAIICHIDLYLKTNRENQDLTHHINPFKLFIEFSRAVHHDHNIILDMLTSNETRMLLLMVRFLKLVLSEWSVFTAAHLLDGANGKDCLETTMSMLIRLNLSIERMQNKNIFPYNVNPLLKLLDQCEELYEAA